MTEKGLNLIKEFEGFRANAYQCPAGVWTIGYGNTFYKDGTRVQKGDIITMEEAEELLDYVSEKNFGTYVDKYVTSCINPYMRDALISFAYNCGNANLKSSTLLKKVNANPNDKAIANEFAKWNKAGGKVLAGLTRRRKAESELYFTEWAEETEQEVCESEQQEEEKYELSFKGCLKK